MTRIEDEEADMIDGILQPNGHFRVPMFLRDSSPNPALSERQRAIAAAAATHDAMTFDAASHRPGHRYPSGTNDSTNNPQRLRYGVFDGAKEKAYSDSDRDLTEAWRGSKSPPAGSYPEGTSHEGSACTVDGAQQTMDAAYAEYDLRIQTSWRNQS